MKIKGSVLSMLAVVGFVGVFMVGSVQALDFVDWNQVWFKLQVKQNPDKTRGKIGDAIPPGSDTLGNYTDGFKTYLVVESCDPLAMVPACDVTLCTFNGTTWGRQATTAWPLLGGGPQKFITLFDFTYNEDPNIQQRFLTPLLVKATVNDNKNPHKITGASIMNLGGAFLVQIGNPVTQYAAGKVVLESTWIAPSSVSDKVPPLCLVTPP